MTALGAGQARELFADARVAYLATVRPDGSPHLVPVAFALDGDRLLSAVDAKPKRHARLARLDNVVAEPRVCLLADGWDEDWSRLWWVRADGDARVRELDAQASRLLARRYPQYAAAPPPGPLVEVAVSRWSGWRAT